MVLQQVFLSPLGLAALLVAVPIVLLYLVRPDPSRVELPTFRFLSAEQRQESTRPLLERLSRSLLLLIQLVAILLLAVSLAAPYVPVPEAETVEETVLVVDTSASMATTDGGQSRFDRALAAARTEVTGTTSVVTTAGGGEVVSQRVTPGEARSTLDSLAVTDAPGDLRGAIAQARALAGENARIVVVSDFAGEDWTDPVSTARARGLSVVLQQFDAGGDSNVGFVDRQFSQSEVTLSVQNFGDQQVTRTVRLGDQAAQVQLGPGDVGTVTLSVPAGGGQARLSPGDDFPTDDRVPVAAPADPTVDVLVLTNDRNRFLTTALSVVDQVELTVENPPTTIGDEYDVIIYSNVEADSLLRGNVQTGRELLANGGGVAIQAQSALPERYGDLLLVEPNGTATAPTVSQPVETDLTRGIDFQPPEEYVVGSLRSGRALVSLSDGSPLIATDERDGGRLLYYGYIEDRSGFKYNYQYPVFWKRAVFELAGRESLAALNHETGETVTFETAAVRGPSGPQQGPTVQLRETGFYETDTRRIGAGMLDVTESAVGVEELADREGAVGETVRTETRTVPRRLTPFALVAALAVIALEIGYVRRRGDL